MKPKSYSLVKDNQIIVTLLVLTFNFLLSSGHSANSCIANVTVANVCIVVGRRDARHTDANTEAFNDNDLEALKERNIDRNRLYYSSSVFTGNVTIAKVYVVIGIHDERQ